MYKLPNDVIREIWKFIMPISDLNNKYIDNTVNNILQYTNYCKKCGENSICKKCEFCFDILYFYCHNCKNRFGNNLICCVDRYNKYGMIN